MTFADAIGRLATGLRAELPGPAAHARLAPVPRRIWPPGFNTAKVRDAAGLLLVFPIDGLAHVILTVRAETVRHAGQVSLPGGVVDPGETFERAALREAHEEVGLPLDDVRVLGALTPVDIPVSGFRLHPIVAASPRRPLLRPSDGEVARIIEASVAELLNRRHLVVTERERNGSVLTVPAFQVANVEIWGATAMVIAEFLALLGWAGGEDG